MGIGTSFLCPGTRRLFSPFGEPTPCSMFWWGPIIKTHLCSKRGCLCAQDDLNIWGPAAIMQAFSLAGRSLGSLGSLGPLLAMQPFARATKIMSRILSRTRARRVEHF